jgi:hypothetical protein
MTPAALAGREVHALPVTALCSTERPRCCPPQSQRWLGAEERRARQADAAPATYLPPLLNPSLRPYLLVLTPSVSIC